jgi:3-phosphoshikimate 1-carboxyvinyltransferase
MLRVVAPLRQMGARIEGRNHGELAPLAISGGALHGIDLELLTASAQVKTAVLLAALRAEGETSVTEPHASRDHTERMLAASGAAVSRSGLTTAVRPGGDLEPSDRRIPGDVSSAMFLVAAAALVERSDLTIDEVGLNPTRTAALEVLKAMGAGIEIEGTGERGGEPVGALHVVASDLKSTTVAGDIVPSLIDEIPILAVVATQAHGTTEFRDASELRVKESDRIATTVEGIRAIGGNAEETPDGLVVHGPTPLQGGRVRSHNDHRVAMAFAIAGLISTANVTVEGWSCVEISFPGFLDVLGRAQGRLR